MNKKNCNNNANFFLSKNILYLPQDWPPEPWPRDPRQAAPQHRKVQTVHKIKSVLQFYKKFSILIKK
jgi:hypothetical protein